MDHDKQPQFSDIIFYSSPEGNVKVEVIFNDETFWLSQKRMAELFDCSADNISLHLKNIFKQGELDQEAVTEEISVTASDKKSYNVKFYNLDAIIAVGYRVNSKQATQFRIWATKLLREFIIKGFVLDDERLKQGQKFGKDYFDELLQRIREIRASERRFYLKITDIYEQCSIDYDKSAAERNVAMKMADWVTKLDAFLQFNEYEVLKDAGKVSHDVAISLAEREFEKFRVVQDRAFVSDFEKEIKKFV